MLRRTRVSTTPDLNRLSQGVQRPGIDPRVWCSLAVATEDEFFDKDHGCFVEVMLLPNGEELTCYVPQQYAGSDFGEHQQTIKANDQLVVTVPNGDPAEGGVVLARFHSKAAKPPQLAQQNPQDFVRVQEKDTSWRLKLQGSGQWVFEGEDEVSVQSAKKQTYDCQTFIAKTGNVRLGAEDATEQVPLGTTWRAKESAMHSTLQSQLGTLIGFITTAGASLTTAGPLTLLPPAGVAIAAAGAALTSAVASITAMQLAITQYETEAALAQNLLSNVSKTK